MSDCGKAVWCELLCSEESASAGLRHARLVWDRGWLSSGRSPFLPVHSPAPSAHFHGTQGVALSSVLTHQPPHAHLWAAHTVSALPVRAPSLPDAAAAAAVTTRVKEKRSSGTKKQGLEWLRGTDKSGAFQCLVEGRRRRSPCATVAAAGAALLAPLNDTVWGLGKFQRLASGKDPAHSVETLGGSSAERASSEQRQCSW